MYNVWGRWRVWKRETRRETKGRSICKHKERHVCQMEGDMIFMSHVFGETTACPCLMPCIFPPCLLTVLCLLTCCYFFSPFCLSVCVCESATIAAFQYMSTYHRWISQSSSSSVWFLHFLPVWRIYFPLRGRRKKKTRKHLPSSCQPRWPQKCEQKHFKSDIVGEHFFFFIHFFGKARRW